MSHLRSAHRGAHNGNLSQKLFKWSTSKAAQSFLVSATINLFFDRNNFQRALIGGTLSATVTLVDAVTRPIIKSIFAGNEFIGRAVQVILPSVAVVSAAVNAEKYLGFSYKPEIGFIKIIAYFSLNDNNWYEKNIALVEVL